MSFVLFINKTHILTKYLGSSKKGAFTKDETFGYYPSSILGGNKVHYVDRNWLINFFRLVVLVSKGRVGGLEKGM